MKYFPAPFVLLPVIIEQSAYMNIKEAIVTVLQQYQLSDARIPC